MENSIRLLRLNASHTGRIRALVKEAVLRQGSETIENLKAFFFNGERVLNERDYYVERRADYFESE